VVEREMAHRVFAREFNDSRFQLQSVSIHEDNSHVASVHSPNFLVTPSGAKSNRVFVVGVVTEVENMADLKSGAKELLRARISDPTGSFTVYAGNYQPEALVFLSNVEVPSYVMVVGKVRSYEPEAGEVFVSIRPEEIHYADESLRNRWIVDTAELTLERVDFLKKALDSGLTGKILLDHLKSLGVPLHLVEGICLSLDYYHTDLAYIEQLRANVKESLLSIKEDGSCGSDEDHDHESLVLEVMGSIAESGSNSISGSVEYAAIITEASSRGMSAAQVDQIVRILLSKGHIYEPRAGVFKVIH